MSRRDRKLRAVLERAVLDELGVDAAITGVVDVLESGSVSRNPQRSYVRGTHLMQKAVAVWVSELPGHVAPRGLNKDINSNRRSNASSSGESPLQEHHFATRFGV